jgi:hypothetical protein
MLYLYYQRHGGGDGKRRGIARFKIGYIGCGCGCFVFVFLFILFYFILFLFVFIIAHVIVFLLLFPTCGFYFKTSGA